MSASSVSTSSNDAIAMDDDVMAVLYRYVQQDDEACRTNDKKRWDGEGLYVKIAGVISLLTSEWIQSQKSKNVVWARLNELVSDDVLFHVCRRILTKEPEDVRIQVEDVIFHWFGCMSLKRQEWLQETLFDRAVMNRTHQDHYWSWVLRLGATLNLSDLQSVDDAANVFIGLMLGGGQGVDESMEKHNRALGMIRARPGEVSPWLWMVMDVWSSALPNGNGLTENEQDQWVSALKGQTMTLNEKKWNGLSMNMHGQSMVVETFWNTKIIERQVAHEKRHLREAVHRHSNSRHAQTPPSPRHAKKL